MNYNYDVGENITITDEFSLWLEDIQKENIKNKEKLKQIKEIIEISNEINIDKSILLEKIEGIINEL